MTAEQSGTHEDHSGSRPGDRPRPGTPPPAIRSDELLRGGNEILIDHAGCLYRLRLTRSGKLILHK